MPAQLTVPQGSPFRLVRYHQDDPAVPTAALVRMSPSWDPLTVDPPAGSWLVTVSAYGRLVGYVQAYVDGDRVVILQLAQAPQARTEPGTVPTLVEAALDCAGLPWAAVEVAVDSLALPYLLSRGWLPTTLVRDEPRPPAEGRTPAPGLSGRAARRLVLSGERAL